MESLVDIRDLKGIEESDDADGVAEAANSTGKKPT